MAQYSTPGESNKKRLYVAAALVIIVVAFLGIGNFTKIPTSAAVTYKVQEPYETEEVFVEKECRTVVTQEPRRECTSKDYRYEISNERVLKVRNPDSDTGWNCIGTFVIKNNEPRIGLYSYEYTFKGEDQTLTKSSFKNLLPNAESSVEFIFPCGVDEQVTGETTSFTVPQIETCKDVTVDRESEVCKESPVTKTVTKYRDVEKTRVDTEYMTLFDAWFGG